MKYNRSKKPWRPEGEGENTGLYAKKSLGQNFLTSQGAVNTIIEVSQIQIGEKILEVGPGTGILTQALLQSGAHITAIEKDDRAIPLLREKFAEHIKAGNLVLIHGDVLEYEPTFDAGSYKIVANIPYYITGEFIRKFLETPRQPSLITIMVQKEVAERIARAEKETILSLSVKAYGTPKYVQTVKAGSFSPPPNVDSAILCISDISKTFFNTVSEEDFFKVVKAGFAHKRKMLAGNLQEIASKEAIIDTFKKLGLSEKVRAEDLDMYTLKNVAQNLL